MKLALITDQHFGVKNDSPIFLEHQKEFYETVFFPYLVENEIKQVIDLGDTFDRRKYINYHTLATVKNFYFDKLQELGITLHIIVGNHSTYYKNTNDVNSPDLILREYSNIVTHSSPQTISFGGCDVLMMPWVNPENAIECFQAMTDTSAQIMMGHFELAEQSLKKNFKFHEGISLKQLKKFDAVYSGHYHHKILKGNFLYLGTPYEMTWDDTNNTKGFHVLDTETRELEFIKNPLHIYSKIMWEDDGTYDINKILEGVKKHPEKHKNKYIKIVVKKKENPYILDRYVDAIEQCGPHNVLTEEITTHFAADEENIDKIEDTLTILKKHIEAMADFQQKEDLMACMEELYTEALNFEE